MAVKLSPPLVMGCLVGGGTLALVAAGGVFYVYSVAFGDAEAVVYNDGSAPLEVKVDGVVTETIPPRKIGRVAVGKGQHVVTTGADYPVEVDGLTTILVPIGREQCFAEVDVSHLYEQAPRETPLVVKTWTGESAIRISQFTEFLRSELDEEIHKDHAPTLVVPVPCEGLSEETAQAYVVENEKRLY